MENRNKFDLSAVWVSGSSKQILQKTKWGKGGMQTHAHFTSRVARYVYNNCYFEKGIKQQSLINQNSTLYLNWIQLKK